MIEDNDKDWIPDEDLEAVNLERALKPTLTPAELANEILNEAAPQAAMTIVRLATSPQVNERVRLSAAQYVIDRATKSSEGSEQNAPWAGVFAAVARDAEQYANGQ